MKSLILMIFTFSAITARAENRVVCANGGGQNSSFSADFTLANSAKVDFFVPDAVTGGETYSGQCHQDAGAIELSLTCNVMMTTDSGYEVRLYSKGGSEVGASVIPFSMLGKGPVKYLRCN